MSAKRKPLTLEELQRKGELAVRTPDDGLPDAGRAFRIIFKRDLGLCWYAIKRPDRSRAGPFKAYSADTMRIWLLHLEAA